MSVFTLSDERHHKLQRIRRSTWMAIAICLVLRAADTVFGPGIIEPAQAFAAQDSHACPAANQHHAKTD